MPIANFYGLSEKVLFASESMAGGELYTFEPLYGLAELVDELFDRQKIGMVGFDIVFAEPDESSGLKRLRQLAQAELKDQPGFADKINQL